VTLTPIVGSKIILLKICYFEVITCICSHYLTQALLGITRAIAKRCCKQFAAIVLVH